MLFISHSTLDKSHALDLQRRLRERGYVCDQLFLDSDQRSGIKIGEKWESTIYDNLRDCQALIVLCSPTWSESKWCFAELACAKMSGKEIFPVVLAECDRSSLSEYQAVFVNQKEPDQREAAFDRFFQALEASGLGPKDYLPWPNPELRTSADEIDPCPFPGLLAFDERYAAVYYGRDQESRHVLEELRKMRNNGEPRFLMIFGSSGSGKSSLLKAGVLSVLKHVSSRNSWLVLPTLRFGQRDADDALFETLADGIVALYPPIASSPDNRTPDRKVLRDRFADPNAARGSIGSLGVRPISVASGSDRFRSFSTKTSKSV